MTINVRKSEQGYCVQASDAALCGLGFTIASGWKLLLYSQYLPSWMSLTFDIIWLAVLALPLGLLVHRSWMYGAACLIFALGLFLVSEKTMLVATPAHEIIAMILGLVIGGSSRILFRPIPQ